MVDNYENAQEEIRIRWELHERAARGEKITAEERMWCRTHRAYNRRLGPPYLNEDILRLEPGQKYSVQVEILSENHPDRISPAVNTCGVGKILPDRPVTDMKGNAKVNKPIKAMIFRLDSRDRSFCIQFESKIGLLGVFFDCDYYVEKRRLHLRESSTTGNPSFAMLREQIGENKVLYRCKSPLSESYDSLVFTIEWTPCP